VAASNLGDLRVWWEWQSAAWCGCVIDIRGGLAPSWDRALGAWGGIAFAVSGLRFRDMAVGAVSAGWGNRAMGVVLRETRERGPQTDDRQIRGMAGPASAAESGPGAPLGPEVVARRVTGDPGPVHLNRSHPLAPDQVTTRDGVAGSAGREHG